MKDKFELIDAIAYLVEKRDDLLENLNDKIKADAKHENIYSALQSVLRVNDQIKTLEDCLVMLRVFNAAEKRMDSATKVKDFFANLPDIKEEILKKNGITSVSLIAEGTLEPRLLVKYPNAENLTVDGLEKISEFFEKLK